MRHAGERGDHVVGGQGVAVVEFYSGAQVKAPDGGRHGFPAFGQRRLCCPRRRSMRQSRYISGRRANCHGNLRRGARSFGPADRAGRPERHVGRIWEDEAMNRIAGAILAGFIILSGTIGWVERFQTGGLGFVLDRWTGEVWQCSANMGCLRVFPPRL